MATAEAALARGRAKGAITILNPAPVRPLPASVLQLVDVLTPNQTEAKVLTGRSPDAKNEPEEVARDLIRAGVAGCDDAGRKRRSGCNRVILQTYPGDADARRRYHRGGRCFQCWPGDRTGIRRESEFGG